MNLAQYALDFCQRHHHRLATLLMIDLDYFKAANDVHDYAEGDAALIAFSHALRDKLRASDIIERMGGDEFISLYSGLTTRFTSPRAAQRMARFFKAVVNCLSKRVVASDKPTPWPVRKHIFGW